MEKKTTLEQFEAAIEKVVDKMDVPEKEKKEQLELFQKIFEEGQRPYQAMGIGDELMEAIYAQGYQAYHRGQFDAAQASFQTLTTLDPQTGKYHLALGAAYQQQKRYEKAISSYMATSFLGDQAGLALYYAADCFLKLGDKACAAMALTEMVDVMGGDEPTANNDPLSIAMKERGKVLLEILKKELIESPQKEKAGKKK